MLDLTAIEQRVRMVDTPPWLAVPVQYNVLGETITGFEVGHAAKMSSAFCRDFDAAKFIREAIIDIPALIARVRELELALAKCGAHTAYLPGASIELLEGLLTSIRRIALSVKSDTAKGLADAS